MNQEQCDVGEVAILERTDGLGITARTCAREIEIGDVQDARPGRALGNVT
jgi:hypothetical protein